MADLDDTINAIRNGEIEAFERLFKAHYPDLYAFGYRFVQDRSQVEDLIQDVFLHIWENRAQLEIRSSIQAYLKTAVKNKALSHLRSYYHLQVAMVPPDEVPAPTSVAASEDKPDTEILMQLVQRGIEQLPKQCRLIFQLSRQSGLTYDEIARELGVSKETVKSQIKIALQKLRAFLGKHWEAICWLGILGST
ncbi:MAG: RNA polymerase sigma-70 factor [Saprospiraceae bacterium]|nr:RNA polymerase sigma-70 factor [Saprospiraceae bacterium]